MKNILGISLLIVLSLPLLCFAHEIPDGAPPFVPSKNCKGCHPVIFEEWSNSMHSQSSAHQDPAHAAVHRKFVTAREKAGKPGNYHCANCHAPMAENLNELMSGKKKLDSRNPLEREGVGCAFCHRIDSILHQKNFNRYRINKDGAFTVAAPSGKAPHKTRGSALFAEGDICMGCHSHKINAKGVSICVMKKEGSGDCLSCHMEKQEGAPAVGSARKMHRSHVMPGGHHPEMLKKAVHLEAAITEEKGEKTLHVTLANRTGHAFPSTSPMRMAFLKVTAVNEGGEIIWTNFSKSPMEDKQGVLLKVFAAGKKVGVPAWQADRVAFDRRLKEGEKRVLTYPLPAGTEKVTITLFYRLFTPKAAKMLEIPAVGLNRVNIPVQKIEVKPGDQGS